MTSSPGPSPAAQPPPAALPRRDRGGLCRGRSAASGHLLPWGGASSAGPRPLARSHGGARAAAAVWARSPGLGSAAFGYVRLGSTGLSVQARPGSAGRKNSEGALPPGRLRGRRLAGGGAIPRRCRYLIGSPCQAPLPLVVPWGEDSAPCAGRGRGGKRAEGAIQSGSLPGERDRSRTCLPAGISCTQFTRKICTPKS